MGPLTPDALEQGYIRSLDESGVVWKETSTYKLIYKGFNYVSAVRPSYGDGALEAHNCIEFLLVNKSQDDALGVYTDKMSINGTDLSPRITKSVIPPQCAGIVQIDVPSRWWPDGMKNMEDGRFALTLKILKPGGVVIDTIEQVIEPSSNLVFASGQEQGLIRNRSALHLLHSKTGITPIEFSE
jgi:homoaconitase/3-isopropylmalate dehydratase large subunit